jgi:DNA-binding MurR/RpiR family transcriptional regulator
MSATAGDESGTQPSAAAPRGGESVLPPQTILVQIRALLPSLPPSEKRVAMAALSDPVGVAGRTISDLAALCQTSETTVARFCRTLGLRGYPELRIGLAAAASAKGGPAASGWTGLGTDIGPRDTTAEVVGKIGLADARAVEETVAQLDLHVMDKAVDALAAANKIDLYGSGASALVALDLQEKLNRIGRRAQSWSDPHLALTSAALLRKGDVAVCVSHSGETPDTLAALREARANGALVIAITNFPRSTLAQQADRVLTTAARETTYRSGSMSSRIAALTVVDCVFVALAQRNRARTLKALERTYKAVRGRRIAAD